MIQNVQEESVFRSRDNAVQFLFLLFAQTPYNLVACVFLN